MSNIIKLSLVAVLSLGLMPNYSFAQDADSDDDAEDAKDDVGDDDTDEGE